MRVKLRQVSIRTFVVRVVFPTNYPYFVCAQGPTLAGVGWMVRVHHSSSKQAPSFNPKTLADRGDVAHQPVDLCHQPSDLDGLHESRIFPAKNIHEKKEEEEKKHDVCCDLPPLRLPCGIPFAPQRSRTPHHLEPFQSFEITGPPLALSLRCRWISLQTSVCGWGL